MKKRKGRRRPHQHGQLQQKRNRQPVNQKHKDRLFRAAFQDRRDLLDLYNAINGTDYRHAEALKITTLEDALFLGMKNDLSFIVGNVLNLYEHQSTKCLNMPLRGLIYFATLYQTYVKENGYDLYGSRRIELPFPVYVVFYNGNAKEADETEYLLSDAFQVPDHAGQPALECRVRVLNINQGHNRELMEKCRRLREYAAFIECVKQNLKDGMEIQEAVGRAMDTCEEQGILTDLLARCRTEVLEMLLAEYDEQKTMEYIRREEREIGREEGREEGEARVNRLNEQLLAEKKIGDLERAVSDRVFRESLYKKYGL